jgi:hypothetical protein
VNSRWKTLVSASLVAFASIVLAWQLVHYDETQNSFSSIVQSCLRGEDLSEIPGIVERNTPDAGFGRALDLTLPKDVRVFMTDMTGPTNLVNLGWYFYVTYYLFPREVGASMDQPTRVTKDGVPGRTSESDQEILAHGFDVRIDCTGSHLQAKALHDLPVQNPLNPNQFGPDGYFNHAISFNPESFNPVWFNSNWDLVMAFLLPLLTALAGMWLFRLVFSTLSEQVPLLEQLACSLGLGMMAVAALTLGVKLCGFSGRDLILSVTAVGGVAEVWRNRKPYCAGITEGYWNTVLSPGKLACFLIGLSAFLILFRLAGLQGFVDPDAETWMLKAKIIHLYTGSEIVQSFSNPRLAYAHLDYPTLVPSLHAATYDSLGHVDEFVTKFWPVWMLLFLLAAMVSLNRAGKSRFHAPSFALLGLLLLPATQMYVNCEGGTLPMVFFTVLGFVQCAFWLAGKDRARLGLGLTLLFGAAMAKFEGFIILALVGSWILLLPSARPSLKPSPRLWLMLSFCFLAALPFICLRVQIPSLNFESGWAGYALHHPGSTLSNCPWIFMILFARLFMSSDFANWSGEGGQLHRIGGWDGFSSLYNHLTLGLAWFCLFMTVVLWFTVPVRRPIIIWMLAMLVSALAAFSMVFASLSNISDLASIIRYTADNAAGRYLFPMLLAWFSTIMTMFFTDLSLSISTPGTSATIPCASTPVGPPVGVETNPKTSNK